MTPDLLSSAHARPMAECETAELGSEFHERLMLLELATDLQNWPARNVVFRKALDRAAQDLVRIAGHADRG
jgi:hypothetical protein